MHLYEHQGKALLARARLQVPAGGLWPDIPSGLRFPVAAKAQVLSGGRGKQGAVLRVDAPPRLAAAVQAILGMSLNGERVSAVLVEEWIEVDRECYLAITLDRDRRAPLLLVGPKGGVDVEETAPPLSLHLDPWLGPRPHHVRLAAEILALPSLAAASLLQGVWGVVSAEDALLVEVNPLGIRGATPIALDARVVVDDNARYRHERWPRNPAGTAFEDACSDLGVSGVEMDGDIGIITSGAGLAMASLDLLTALGGRARALVDLGSVVFQRPEKIATLMAHLAALRPRVLLFNFFLQLARCDTIAAGIEPALPGGPWERVVVRMRGVRAEEARLVLEPVGAEIYEELGEAFAAAVGRARG